VTIADRVVCVLHQHDCSFHVHCQRNSLHQHAIPCYRRAHALLLESVPLESRLRPEIDDSTCIPTVLPITHEFHLPLEKKYWVLHPAQVDSRVHWAQSFVCGVLFHSFDWDAISCPILQSNNRCATLFHDQKWPLHVLVTKYHVYHLPRRNVPSFGIPIVH